MKNNNYKVNDQNIKRVVVKRFNKETDAYDIVYTADDMVFDAFVDYLNNISTLGKVHWSIDCLNPVFTTASVYVEL